MIEFIVGAVVMLAVCAAFPAVPDAVRKAMSKLKGGSGGEGNGTP